MPDIAGKLEIARQELLDLSLRNTLVNYRLLKSRGVQVVDELPEEVFRILVLENRVMSFLPAAEVEDEEEKEDSLGDTLDLHLEQPEEEIAEAGIAERHTDDKLQTPHNSAELQKRLLNTYYAARTYIEEQGANILYFALGMLNWYESPSSNLLRQAPLILIPVELYRTDVQTRFRVRYTEDDLSDNISLGAKLKQEFGIQLPELSTGEDLDVQAYFTAVVNSVDSQERWSVDHSAVALGFFSFGTFLMYKDLDEVTWPEGAKPTEHSLMRALLGIGFREPTPPMADDEHIDDHVRPQDSNQIVDADSSQIQAILDVNHGRNLVIQGPPGTGKSQTITNIIAEALGQGKSVLFVAEKMAALEVVKRRLDAVGLGDACLELHSQKTQKKVLLDALRYTLDLGRPKTQEDNYDEQLLLENQKLLNAYCEAVNTPVGHSGVIPFYAFGKLVQLKEMLQGLSLPTLDDHMMQSWSKANFLQRLRQVEELQRLLGRIGPPVTHPFWGSQFRGPFLPGDESQLRQVIQAAGKNVSTLQDYSGKLASHLRLGAPGTRREAEKLASLTRRLMDAPELDGIQMRAKEWFTKAEAIQSALEDGGRAAYLQAACDKWLIPEAWEQDVLQIHQALVAYGPKWWRFLSGSYRQAQDRLKGLCRDKPPEKVSSQLKLVEAILEVQRLEPILAQNEPLLKRLFLAHWQGKQSDWKYFSGVAAWLTPLYQDIHSGIVPVEVLHYLDGQLEKKKLDEFVKAIEKQLDEHMVTMANVSQQFELDEAVRFGKNESLLSQPFYEQLRLLKAWYLNIEKAQEIVAYNHQVDHLVERDLGALVPIVSHWPEASHHLTELVEKTWYESLVRKAFQTRPSLQQFSGEIHEHRIEQFCKLDQKVLNLNKARLALRHWARLPNHEAGGQLGVLKREFAKKRRHLPIRKLMHQAGNAIQTIKPVFMMSPLSIAMFLPPDSITFDLVVFDEASQVRPVEAFGAILRGKQTVVVGDSRQLPPTSFFQQVTEVDEEVESPTADLESVLTLFLAQSAPERMLRWHYRSRHESLIAVSNYEFYDNKLVIFPSPSGEKEEVGLVFHHLPDAFYDRGKSRTNPNEAQVVAEAVMAHARNHPGLSLGVAAFSTSQMEAIQLRLESLRKQEPSCEHFFNSHPEEPFFVKNLENVQGDERDVIFISVGYGREANGRFSMNFGPLNKEGGERRLNVLITRARLRCEVFTSITADDINLRRTNARGVVAFKQYLQYAETGKLNIPIPSERDPDSPFEEAVADALRRVGYEVAHQIGSAGFFVDLAVVDKERPGRYLLGIECDGATYHSARSARDRDRLRQQVLENLGWRIHRIWSTDWFRNPGAELRRAVKAIEAARSVATGEPLSTVSHSVSHNPVERHGTKPLRNPVQAERYRMASLRIPRVQFSGVELHEVPRQEIAGWVKQVVEVESPVHVDEVIRRICDAYGIKRAGNRIRGIIQQAITYSVQRGVVKQRDKFLWHRDMVSPNAIRSRAKLSSVSRKIDLIAPEEITLAIETIVRSASGMQRDEIPSAVCSVLGFGRTSEDMKQQVEAVINDLVAKERLVMKGAFLIVADG